MNVAVAALLLALTLIVLGGALAFWRALERELNDNEEIQR